MAGASNIAFKKGRQPNEAGAKGLGNGCTGLAVQHHEGATMSSSNSRSFNRRKSQSRHDHNLPRNGNVLPREKLQSDDVAKAQGAVLQGVFGNLKSPAKEMARETGLNERACRNQLAGLNSMNLADFFNACRNIPELRAWGAEMMGMLLDGDPKFYTELARGRQEIVLRIDTGGLTLGKGGD